MKIVAKLLKGDEMLSFKELEKFEVGDTIWSDGATPKELALYTEEEFARREFKHLRSIYNTSGYVANIIEYALEFATYDDEGNLIEGANYELAEALEC